MEGSHSQPQFSNAILQLFKILRVDLPVEVAVQFRVLNGNFYLFETQSSDAGKSVTGACGIERPGADDQFSLGHAERHGQASIALCSFLGASRSI